MTGLNYLNMSFILAYSSGFSEVYIYISIWYYFLQQLPRSRFPPCRQCAKNVIITLSNFPNLAKRYKVKHRHSGAEREQKKKKQIIHRHHTCKVWYSFLVLGYARKNCSSCMCILFVKTTCGNREIWNNFNAGKWSHFFKCSKQLTTKNEIITEQFHSSSSWVYVCVGTIFECLLLMQRVKHSKTGIDCPEEDT